MEEVWKEVKGYEDLFEISSFSRLRSKRSGKVLSQTALKTGYLTHATKIGGRKGKNVCFRIHILVAEVFLQPPAKELLEWAKGTKYGKVFVNHIDGNKKNNLPSNLEWVTAKQNMEHAIKLGLFIPLYGAENLSSKFTEEEVSYIRGVYIPRDKIFGATALAKRFNSTKRTILDIVNFKSYNR